MWRDNNMALIETCFCCSVAIASGFFAVYLLIAYLIAFAFELLWVLQSVIPLPVAAVLLCAGYFTMALFAALLIHGLATKSTICLLAWMISSSVLTFPEAGLVIYMSIQYWRIESLYGMTELACWLVRILATMVQLILVQSLNSLWKEERMITERLKDLNMTALPISGDTICQLNPHCYQNNAFEQSLEQFANLGPCIKRSFSTPHLWGGALPNNLVSLPFDGYQFCTTQSEFNASIFAPNILHNEINIGGKKAQSMMDLRYLEETFLPDARTLLDLPTRLSQSQGTLMETSSAILPSYTLSKGNASPKLARFASLDALNDTSNQRATHIIRNRTGFYAQPLPNYGLPIYYGPLDGPDFLIYRKQVDKLNSKNSLSNTSTDDVQKYRDIAL